MSETPALPIKPYVWRHKDEADIIQQYLAEVQKDRERGSASDDEAELSDTETVSSSDSVSSHSTDDSWTPSRFLKGEDALLTRAEKEQCKEWDGFCNVLSGSYLEFFTSFEDYAPYNPNKPVEVLDQEDLRETLRAWDDVALGRAPFDSRRKLVQWHESLMRALNEVDNAYTEMFGGESTAVQRRAPAVDLDNDWNIDQIVDELRMRSTIEVEHAPIENLRRGLLYLARALHLKETRMERRGGSPPTFERPPDTDSEPEHSDDTSEEDSEYVFV
ncbi:hypothetical protein DAEQUDRAFT_728967 [Daedalea quercina L-15889]|uniref:Uncharacterized protein n=1 Tax=Daedalea quercina L-15889 TaxID=1314783 RepID=A0A165NYE9_9APHY|nr:hypothetical protein DAEQUDRAFT_728967 [Daedalea quercina L-15889]